MRRVVVTLLGVLALAATAALPVAADTPGVGTYRALEMAYESCNDLACTTTTAISLQAAVDADGSSWIDFRFSNGTTVLVGQAYTETPPAFTMSGDFIVGVPETTLDFSYSDGSPTPQTGSVTIAASVTLTGKIQKKTSNQIVKDTCRAKYTTVTYTSGITGSLTVDSTPFTPNLAPTNSQYSVVTVTGNCP